MGNLQFQGEVVAMLDCTQSFIHLMDREQCYIRFDQQLEFVHIYFDIILKWIVCVLQIPRNESILILCMTELLYIDKITTWRIRRQEHVWSFQFRVHNGVHVKTTNSSYLSYCSITSRLHVLADRLLTLVRNFQHSSITREIAGHYAHWNAARELVWQCLLWPRSWGSHVRLGLNNWGSPDGRLLWCRIIHVFLLQYNGWPPHCAPHNA